MDRQLTNLLIKYKAFIDKYSWSSYTLGSIEHLEPALIFLRSRTVVRSMVDLGCGYGVLTCIVAEYLGAEEVWGVDIDDERLNAEKPCKIVTVKHDLTKPLTMERKFDLVTSFGVLEHLDDWDTFIDNAYTLLNKEGWLLLSVPNLGSWINRIALLLGYQPRDLEISSKRPYHVLPQYRGHPTGHIKIATLGAIEEFLEDRGFKVVKVWPLYAKDNVVANVIDRILKPFPSLARRFIVLAQKQNS